MTECSSGSLDDGGRGTLALVRDRAWGGVKADGWMWLALRQRSVVACGRGKVRGKLQVWYRAYRYAACGWCR